MTESKTEIDKHNVEDKRQYLAFLQGAIERMARNSASLKQWIIPVLALCFGAAMTSKSVLLGVAGIAAIFIFWMLDAYYLMLERSYRKTFEKAVNDEKDLYDMRPEETERGFLTWVCCLKAAATAPVYVGLLLLGVIVIVCA